MQHHRGVHTPIEWAAGERLVLAACRRHPGRRQRALDVSTLVSHLPVAGDVDRLRSWVSAYAHAVRKLMSWSANLALTVIGGVLVAAVIAMADDLWSRRRVPTALSRSVRRKHYVDEILARSTSEEIMTLDVLTPRFVPRRDNEAIAKLQAAWEQINARGKVRVVIGNTEEALIGGAELLSLGIEVRVASTLIPANLSFHLFAGENTALSVVNYQEDGRNQPAILNGISPLQVFRSHFDVVWKSSDPFGAIIADQIVGQVGPYANLSGVKRTFNERCVHLRFETKTRDLIIPHLAFRHSSSVIFIVGLPGAGKSFVRRRLAAHLRSLRIQSQELTDYVFAYRDFLHGSIQLEPPRGTGFKPESGGAFRVMQEDSLRPALQALSHRVLASLNEREVTLVEFARSDILAALQEFGDELRQVSQIIYVEAPSELRARRLRQRARPPELGVSGVTVTVTVSDDHRLPSTVERSIYSADDLANLQGSRRWEGRIFRILNDADDPSQVDAAIRAYVNRVTSLYASPSG
jgi:hypothetical protein